MTIELAGYRDPRVRYHFDPSTRKVTWRGRALPNAGIRGASGFGASRVLGLAPWLKRVFVAVYVAGGTLRVSVGASEFDWSDASLRASRYWLAPFVSRFTVTRSGHVELRVTYFYARSKTFPDDGDIFSYIARITKTQRQIADITRVWTASGEGKDVGSSQPKGLLPGAEVGLRGPELRLLRDRRLRL
jgi:hypothetical protein